MASVNLRNDVIEENIQDSFLKYGKRLYKKRKTPIFNQGQAGEGIYYLHQGLVKIVTFSSNGNERILDIPKPGQFIGEQVMDQRFYFSSAYTIEDSVIYYFPLQKIQQIINHSPEVNLLVINSMIHKIRLLASNIMLSSFSAEQRIAAALLDIYNGNQSKPILITQQDLANYVGLTRITVYKILKDMKQDKIIDIKNRTIFIERPDMLEKFMEL